MNETKKKPREQQTLKNSKHNILIVIQIVKQEQYVNYGWKKTPYLEHSDDGPE